MSETLGGSASPSKATEREARERASITVVAALVRELHPQRFRYIDIHPSSRIERDLGIDSLGRTELILRIERAFRVRLPVQTIGEAENVMISWRRWNRPGPRGNERLPKRRNPPMRLSQIEEHLRRQAGILRNAGACMLITMPEERRLAGLIRAQVETMSAVESVASLETSSAPLDLPRVGDPESVALIQYPSGSTGDPKGVVLSHANLLADIRAIGGLGGWRAKCCMRLGGG